MKYNLLTNGITNGITNGRTNGNSDTRRKLVKLIGRKLKYILRGS